MRKTLAILLLSLATTAGAQSFQLHGFLSAREIYVNAQPSWLQDGVGRFDVGADTANDHRLVNTYNAQLGFDWTPATWFLVHADGVGRHQESGSIGKKVGLIQAYADLFNDHWRFRAGEFWLPTSRENTDPLWTSKYTITYSALNSWMAQEVRPIGADLQWSPSFYVTAGVTAFRGNDTMGTLLAGRGWTFGNYLAAYNESLPTPEPELTRPFGEDLDGKNGYAERIRVSLPERAMIQLTHIDNRATIAPGPVKGEEPWATRFNIVGAEFGSTAPVTVAAEWMRGSTQVGFPGGSFTMNFDTAYLLGSYKFGHERLSGRIERFATSNAAHAVPDLAREHGHAFTVAWMHETNARSRAGLEYCRVSGDRPGLAADFDPRTGGSTVTVEYRYSF
ncbi:MAG TPA: hypothetical protein VGQ21_17540 [Thermoanaerobaculia bacterium]|jgi:hypothetical protein|nr:hypothetical protein [Thermoanaerobaculia bacterium]